MSADDIYIQLAISALIYIRERCDKVDDDVKDFTYIAESILESMEEIHELKDHEHVHNVTLYALREYEKVDFDGPSIAMRGLYRSLIATLNMIGKTREGALGEP